MMLEHEHPLNLIDLWLEHLQLKEKYEEDEEEDENEPIAKQDFQCSCSRCEQEINWYHRYYYTCSQCGYFIHKFCAQLPERLEDICHPHTLYLLQRYVHWHCNICRSYHTPHDLRYRCSQCDFDVDVRCATKRLQKNIIYHPSHTHPLVRMIKQIICECDACGEKHEGIFYQCLLCTGPFIHNHCAFLPIKLKIQKFTDDSFSHIHPLDLCYSFPKVDQESKFNPLCRVCRRPFEFDHLWIYKCEKCRYYTHLNCATSRNEPFMSILASPGTTIKTYKDVEHPDLVHLPFPDPSYSIIRHLFFKENGSRVLEINSGAKTHISHHQHPLILWDARCCSSDHITSSSPAYSRIKPISYHDPMKKIELLCDVCIRPIMSGPIYVCANEEGHCNFVLHEWCSRLPTELKDHPHHPQHILILRSKIPDSFYGVFHCYICHLHCNGFAYCCKECTDYNIDVHCAFMPTEITHASHPNHLLSRGYLSTYSPLQCSICGFLLYRNNLFGCHSCGFQIHAKCALLIPETTTIKLDKHPMKLSYFPVENHESEYFCEVCEEELNPELSFYHCHECMQSMHTECAPSILRYDMQIRDYFRGVHLHVNMKFGRTYILETHPHPLSLVQGLESDGKCTVCWDSLKNKISLKCLNCELAIHHWCWMKLST